MKKIACRFSFKHWPDGWETYKGEGSVLIGFLKEEG